MPSARPRPGVLIPGPKISSAAPAKDRYDSDPPDPVSGVSGGAAVDAASLLNKASERRSAEEAHEKLGDLAPEGAQARPDHKPGDHRKEPRSGGRRPIGRLRLRLAGFRRHGARRGIGSTLSSDKSDSLGLTSPVRTARSDMDSSSRRAAAVRPTERPRNTSLTESRGSPLPSSNACTDPYFFRRSALTSSLCRPLNDT